MTGSIEARSCTRATWWLRLTPLALAGCVWLGPAGAVHAQEPASEAGRISVEWNGAPMGDVLRAFADFSGKSMVAGPEVGGHVTAFIDDQPWDVALGAILSAHGLTAVEDEHGIVRVAALGVDPGAEEGPIVTRAYRLSFAKASELHGTLAPHLSGRGSISVAESTNTLIITDFESVHRTIAGLLR
jgi:type II secretory pathway component HofQ